MLPYYVIADFLFIVIRFFNMEGVLIGMCVLCEWWEKFFNFPAFGFEMVSEPVWLKEQQLVKETVFNEYVLMRSPVYQERMYWCLDGW